MTREMKMIYGGALCVLIILVGVNIAIASEPPPAETEVYNLPDSTDAPVAEPVAAREVAFEGYVVRSDGAGVAVYSGDGERIAELDILPAKLRAADAAELERGISVADDEALARLIEDLSS